MYKYLCLFIVFPYLVFSSSCKKDVFIPEGDGPLSFSEDTVIFDTVFSTIGSITKVLKVYNNTNNDLTISDIRITGGTNSNYIINADGIAGPVVKDLFLRKRDSLFLFVEVTVDPQNSNTPMIVEDSIEFTTNQELQKVNLVSWGQDAYYHTPNASIIFLDENNDTIRFNYYSVSCGEIWDNQKPHVIYGYAIVEPGCELNIDAGVMVHSYANSGIIVGYPFEIASPSTLKINGLPDNPVTFTHTRLDEFYKNDPGLWDRIWFTTNSQNNIVNHAIIKNGSIGIQADSNINANPTVVINNSWIHNHAGLGILGQGAKIEATNTIVSDCGQYLVALILGGSYDFTHCTFANNWSFGSSSNPSILINNYFEDINENINARDLEKASFTNCIIWGNQQEEIGLDSGAVASFNYLFEFCAIKTEESQANNQFLNCFFNPSDLNTNGSSLNPFFEEWEEENYNLLENSVAVDGGVPTPVTSDYYGNMRDGSPDIGAIEYAP